MKQLEQKELLIVIPAYNEERNIVNVLEQLATPEIKAFADILVVNDASKDATADIAQKYGVWVHTNRINHGYGCSLQWGYRYAVRHGYRYVIQMDADGQHDICNVFQIYEKLKTKDASGHCPDLVLGSRFLKGSQSYPMGCIQQAAYGWFRFLIRLFTGTFISDPTTGLQGLSIKAVKYYCGTKHFDNRYPDANMIVQMLLLHFRVVEIPAVMHPRIQGKSMHSGWKPVIYMIYMTIAILNIWLKIKVLHMEKITGRAYAFLDYNK